MLPIFLDTFSELKEMTDVFGPVPNLVLNTKEQHIYGIGLLQKGLSHKIQEATLGIQLIDKKKNSFAVIFLGKLYSMFISTPRS